MADRIMYVCEGCNQDAPEACGHFDREDLVITPDGKWLCDGCYEDWYPNGWFSDENNGPKPLWSSLPHPPEYGPVVPPVSP